MSTVVGQRCAGLPTTYWRLPASRDRLASNERAESRSASAFVRMRAVAPLRRLSVAEAKALATTQADILLRELNLSKPPVPTESLTSLPRIEVRSFAGMPISAFAQWDRTHWLIGLNATEPPTRQRFSLVHEIKHILDSPFDFTIYDRLSNRDRERISDHFAAAVLMPARWIERAHRYPTDIRGLARTFDVSPLAMRLRLVSLNLID